MDDENEEMEYAVADLGGVALTVFSLLGPMIDVTDVILDPMTLGFAGFLTIPLSAAQFMLSTQLKTKARRVKIARWVLFASGAGKLIPFVGIIIGMIPMETLAVFITRKEIHDKAKSIGL